MKTLYTTIIQAKQYQLKLKSNTKQMASTIIHVQVARMPDDCCSPGEINVNKE